MSNAFYKAVAMAFFWIVMMFMCIWIGGFSPVYRCQFVEHRNCIPLMQADGNWKDFCINNYDGECRPVKEIK